MKFLVSALLLPLLAGAAILPETIGPYHRGAVSQPALADRAVWDEYGLKASEQATYENGSEHFTATAWQMGDSTSGLAVFNWQRPAQATPPSFGARTSVQTGDSLLVLHGNYVLSFAGYKPSKEELDAVTGGLNNVDNTSLPVLAGYLPAENRVPNSERYVIGPAGLQRFDPSIPPSVAAFRLGAEAAMGTYHGPHGDLTMAIFRYPTPQIAMQIVPAFENLPGAIAKRSGPMVAVVLGNSDRDFAEQILGKVRYQAEITRDEYVPTKRDNPGHMVYNIFVLTGILLAFALVSGLVLGGARAIWRYKHHGQEADAMITLDLQ